MQVNISWRHIEPSKSLEKRVDRDLGKLAKFSTHILTIDAILELDGTRSLVELRIKRSKTPVFIVKEQSYDMYQAFNSCLDKIKRIIKQHESKVREKR